ncbi:hypothetical protein HED60_22665 [Planctomycetales bacterium ZRK34]|nr:hypothetical protein HED60_22665 [Planctomycetales bacterium ZRK34]
MYRFTFSLATLMLATVLVGCGESPSASTSKPASLSAASLPDSAIAAESPGEATPIAKLKSTAKAGDQVTLRAVVGGRSEPFVKDRAIMLVVDATLPRSCGVEPDDPCKTPWDYCCSASEELMPNLATVQIVDAEGAPLKVDLGSGPIKPFDTIVVSGSVGDRPDDKTLVVNTSSVYVENAP